MSGLLLRAPAEDHRALCTPDLTGLHPEDGPWGMAATNPLAPGTSAQQTAADDPERH
ncbi:hypothetical protein ABZU25_17600 [Micromonospora sp. NPDC005215]|uniref:hypothetical protein n=1 Tax=Micromonospora sp. NPDC005215 TaxID=3157024 RepID=UPI0033A08D93